MDVFLTSASGNGARAGVWPTASGLSSALAGGAGAAAGASSGFLRAKTECPATELRLRVLVKNDGRGLAAERSDCPNGVASCATLLTGLGGSADAPSWSWALLEGSCGRAFGVEFSDDLALEIDGIASFVDFFSGKTTCAAAAGFSCAIGFTSSLIDAEAGASSSGFFKANTECPETELLLLVLVKNKGLGLEAESKDGPIGFGFSFSIGGKVEVFGTGDAGTLLSG